MCKCSDAVACGYAQADAWRRGGVLSGAMAALARHAALRARARTALAALLQHRQRAAWAGWRDFAAEAAEAKQRAAGLQLRVVYRLQHQVPF